MIGYIHIYVDGKIVTNWRYFQEDLPKFGDEITPSSSTTHDIRYRVKSVELIEKYDHGDLYRIHCDDLTKEFYGPPKPKLSFMGMFHKIDPVVMKMFPDYTKGDVK